MRKLRTEHAGYCLIFIAGSLWGVIGVFVKELEKAGATPELTSFLRVFWAFVIMVMISAVKCGWRALAVDRRTLLICAMLGVVCHGVYNIFYSFAVTTAGMAISAVLLNIAPVFTLLFSMLCFGETFTLVKLIAILINVTGCVLTVTNGELTVQAVSWIGILSGVGAGFCYSMTAIIGRFAANRTDSLIMSTYSYLFASVFLGLWMRPWEQRITVNTGIIGWSMLYALIPTAFAYVIYYRGLQKITESSKVPVIASVETVVAAILGVLLYHEHLGILSVMGIVLVLVSIVIMNVKTRKRA